MYLLVNVLVNEFFKVKQQNALIKTKKITDTILSNMKGMQLKQQECFFKYFLLDVFKI